MLSCEQEVQPTKLMGTPVNIKDNRLHAVMCTGGIFQKPLKIKQYYNKYSMRLIIATTPV